MPWKECSRHGRAAPIVARLLEGEKMAPRCVELVPADLYARSLRVYRGLEDLTYPFHDHTITVTRCGRICFKRRKPNLSQVFAGQNLGVTQVAEHVWLVTFMQYDLGYFGDETCRLEPIDNPFGPKVLPMSPE